MSDAPVLDLATLIERPRVRIDGEAYEMLSPEEISIVDHQRFAAMGRRLDELMGKDALSKQEGAAMRRTADDLARQLLPDVPSDVYEKLSDAQKVDIIQVFFSLLMRRRLSRLAPTNGSTSARSRPGSAASSGHIPPTGSTKRRSASSGPASS